MSPRQLQFEATPVDSTDTMALPEPGNLAPEDHAKEEAREHDTPVDVGVEEEETMEVDFF